MPSTVIRSYQYFPEKEILFITFITGKRYQYFKVTQQEYDDFSAAFSKGTFFNQFIKPNHSFRKLKD